MNIETENTGIPSPTTPSYNDQFPINFITNFTGFSEQFSDQCRSELERWLARKTETLPVTTDVDVARGNMGSGSRESSSRHEELLNENSEVGFMFVSKPIVQAITNLFVGPLTAK